MKYNIGDKVIIIGREGIFTVANTDDAIPQYRLENWKHTDMGWYPERLLSHAGNLVDPEEATEEFKERLESGYFDESDKYPLPGKEIDDVLKAVNTVQKHQSEINPDDTYGARLKEEYVRGYENGYNEAKTEFYENRYQEGLQDAWEMTLKIINMSLSQRKEILGDYAIYDSIQKNTASEALEKIKAYEQRIEVGDEIICKCPEEQKCVVVRVSDKESLSITLMRKDGSCYSRSTDGCTKTGKHYDIQSILDELKED